MQGATCEMHLKRGWQDLSPAPKSPFSTKLPLARSVALWKGEKSALPSGGDRSVLGGVAWWAECRWVYHLTHPSASSSMSRTIYTIVDGSPIIMESKIPSRGSILRTWMKASFPTWSSVNTRRYWVPIQLLSAVYHCILFTKRQEVVAEMGRGHQAETWAVEDPRGKDWFVGGPGRPGRPKFRKEAGSMGWGKGQQDQTTFTYFFF